jgi:MFS family permease
VSLSLCGAQREEVKSKMVSQASAVPAAMPPRNSIVQVIVGSATGTMIEWYDFYIFGSLTSVLAVKFYPPGNDTFALIAYLATFAVGFLVRPFGALFFGRLGDLAGRRIAFIITLTIMGFSTASIGLLPTFKTAGWFSPVILIVIRMLQGLALGGEYGGAAVYVAEHVEDRRRGFYTSFIQITATLGLFISLGVIVVTQQSMSPEKFQAWGWRLPFLLSLILVCISLYIRIRMKESPIYAQIKSAGMHSARPLTDAFTKWSNLRLVLISMLGATAGQGVVWYTGQFYALFFLQAILRVNGRTANIIVAVALLASMPFFTVFGSLSDRIGRKKLMMTALLLSIIFYIPIYKGMQKAAGNNVVSVISVKDRVTGALKLTPLTQDPATGKQVPAKEATNANQPMLMLLIFVQVIFVCMIYGPIAAYLVEAFPAKVRYTCVSLPYHLGNGVFGGLLPLIGLGLCASTGNIFAGLYYPMGVAAVSLIVGTFFLKETHGTLIWDEVKVGTPFTTKA